MNKLQQIRDALQKYAADEAECHVRGMTHIPKTACDALATLDALMETHAIVAISPNKKAFKILWNINNFNSIDECCTFYETLIAAAQEQK